MLSAAAFMDPDAVRMVSAAHTEDKHSQHHQYEGDYHHRSQRTSFVGEEQQHHRHIQHRPQMMAKTVSAPVSSLSRLPLHPLSRMPPRPRDLVVEETDMDVDGIEHPRRPSISDSSSQCSTGTQTLITKGPGMRHHSISSPTSSSRHIPPAVVASATASSKKTSATTTTTSTSTGTPTSPTTTTVSSNGRNDLFPSTTPVSSSSHGLFSSANTTTTTAGVTDRRSSKSQEPLTTARLSFTISKKEEDGHRVREEHEDVVDKLLSKKDLAEEELEEGEVEEEDEEDEVMSEGVVYVNNHLTPIALSPPNKVQQVVPPLIVTSGPAFKQQQQQSHQSHGQDPPKTPTSARTPRTPKQARPTPKTTTPRPTKRSQNDPISVLGNGSAVAASANVGGFSPTRGKSSARDLPVDYFYSPFPPSISSPASSPSSPSPFQLQLLQLTRNFVSVQPHASPTSRFRRATNSGALSTHGILPFSPPVSPGQDLSLLRESASTHSSPTKSHGSHSHSARGAHSHRSSPGKPKWHTQPYMMFLALRAMPNRTAARQELIHAAVELDKKFSAEKGLPRVFTGKTPMNSASACLTNNGDKYFIPFKPEGSRSTHFRLAYQPCDFDTAVADYYGWMEELIRHDWPLCFGVSKSNGDTVTGSAGDATMTDTVTASGSSGSRPDFARADSSDSRKRGPDLRELADEDLLMQLASGNSNNVGSVSKKIKAAAPEDDRNGAGVTETVPASSFALDEISSLDYYHVKALNSSSGSAKATSVGVRRLDVDAAGRLDEPNSCPPTPATATALALERGLNLNDSPLINSNTNDSIMVKKGQQEDLDLSRVPKSLAEVVEVKESKLSNAGKGLFAKIDLPAGTPLGFYFGMPISENEFDSLKEGVGAASQYAIMYRRTVLDATDEQGLPFKLDSTTLPWEQQQRIVVDGQVEGQELLCPFNVLNEDLDGNVSLITGSVVNQVICTTNRYVKEGEELVVFFARDSERHWPVLATPPPPTPSAHAPVPKTVKPVVPGAAPATSNAKTTRKAATVIAAGEVSEGSEGSGVEAGRWSHDSASPSGRPRRDTVYKPVRYSR
ncbi:hypothetical protein EC957_008011 [Mortierella hygrophila]|uniref:SET domain-containing protein n=1 Tax=Mortierella hygrophila TaxID=979708 RepID=A0A9P6FCY8_9FUNG|nr:hypothetical protein EC957_008011 [Mortierella hygrophila]